MLDAGTLGHAHEQFAQPRILDPGLGPVDEQLVHVMLGDTTGDGVQVSAPRFHTESFPFSTPFQPRFNGYARFGVRGNTGLNPGARNDGRP
jgi:hypothetical protein